MKQSLLLFSLFLAALSPISPLSALKKESLLAPNRAGQKIFVNNRIVARVGGKSISTYDLMKKLDLTFYRQYPQFASSAEARYQFYEMSWQHVLSEMIDKELILADAEESKITVSAGDIRQEMEEVFGPNIISNLDKAGLSYDEAAKMMQEEILIQRLIGGRVHAKAIRQVTPSKIRAAYEIFSQDPANTRHTQWTYRIVTIKERSLERTEEAAQAAHELLLAGTPLDSLDKELKEQKVLGRKGSLTVSNTLQQNDKEIIKEYGEKLAAMDKGTFSAPFAQKSRANNTLVYRILFLEATTPGGIASYQEMEVSLKDKLLNQAVDRETDSYLLKLREHYHIRQQDLDTFIPADYQPFTLI